MKQNYTIHALLFCIYPSSLIFLPCKYRKKKRKIILSTIFRVSRHHLANPIIKTKRYSTPPYFISLCLFKRIVLSNYFGMTNCRESGGLRSNEEKEGGLGGNCAEKGRGRGRGECTVSNRRDKVSALAKPGLKTFRPVERFNYGCFFAFPYSKYQTADCFTGFIINPRVCSLS